MTEGKHRVRIAQGDFELEVEGDVDFIEEMLARYVGTTPGAVSGMDAGLIRGNAKGSTREMSGSEFIRGLGFTKHTDRALAFGYFLEHSRDQSSFTSSDINALYYESKMEPSNTSATLSQLVKRGHIMEAKGAPKGAARSYTLTQSGVDFIEEALASPSR